MSLATRTAAGSSIGEGGDEEGAGEDELALSLYCADYALEPEDTAGMAFEEGQLVRIVGRGDGPSLCAKTASMRSCPRDTSSGFARTSEARDVSFLIVY